MRNLENLRIVDRPGGASLLVKAVPGSRGDRVMGVLGEALKLAVAAPPEKGKANAALAAVLAEALGVPPRDVRLLAGSTSPRKEFLVAGLSADQLRRRLADL